METGTEKRLRELIEKHLKEPKSAEAARFESELKLPTCGTVYPSLVWIACVVCPTSKEANLHSALTPERWEAEQVGSYIDYKLTTMYRDSYAARVREQPLPLCAGHNTVVFIKLAAEAAPGFISSAVGWGYRRTSWRTGSWPHSYGGAKATNLPDGPLTLVQVIDHCESFGGHPNPKWEQWKIDHPELFPSTPQEA